MTDQNAQNVSEYADNESDNRCSDVRFGSIGNIENAALKRAIERVRSQSEAVQPHAGHNTKHASHSSHSKCALW